MPIQHELHLQRAAIVWEERTRFKEESGLTIMSKRQACGVNARVERAAAVAAQACCCARIASPAVCA
jgi:hypothetical protein